MYVSTVSQTPAASVAVIRVQNIGVLCKTQVFYMSFSQKSLWVMSDL